jgi:glucose-6-phosphate isomerase
MTTQIHLTDTNLVAFDDRGRTPAFFCLRKPAAVDRALVDELKGFAAAHNVDVRVCLHEGPDADFHDMLILQRRGYFHPVHKHAVKGETWHMIEGRLGAFVFDDAGQLLDGSLLSLGHRFLYRVGTAQYHTVIPASEVVIYHEGKRGPFLGADDAIVAPWGPKDAQEGVRYNADLLARLAATP